MAKGRKYESDRRDRLLGTYGYTPTANGHAAGADQQELGEEELYWSAAGNNHDGSREPARSEPERNRWLARPDRHVGGLSLAFEGRRTAGPTVIHQARHVDGGGQLRWEAAASAPVNVPDWGRMVRVDSADSVNDRSELEEEEEEGGEWVPPHEYLAREHGKRVTTSVFEGVGRTLKGRDMSRVRDAVWSQTGFFG